jgi:hypothetical protein
MNNFLKGLAGMNLRVYRPYDRIEDEQILQPSNLVYSFLKHILITAGKYA